MRPFPLLIAVLILLALPAAAQEGDFTPFQRPGANAGPTEVEIYVFILDIDRIDTQHQSLEINLAYGARWNDPREAHDGEGAIVKPLQSVWHPNLQILSQQRAWSTMPEAVRIAPDGSVTYGQRVWGSFTQRFDLRDFPLDSQTVELQVVSAGNGPTDLRFVGSTSPPSTVAEQLSMTDWDLVSVRSEANEVTYVAGYRPSPGFQLSFVIERRIGFFVAKVIIPLILIVAMSWIVFWIDPEEGWSSERVLTERVWRA